MVFTTQDAIIAATSTFATTAGSGHRAIRASGRCKISTMEPVGRKLRMPFQLRLEIQMPYPLQSQLVGRRTKMKRPRKLPLNYSKSSEVTCSKKLAMLLKRLQRLLAKY